ncbi:MAG: hypothetical protein H6746_18875 [Deltaproteobacteria bacterium]|nr:hypothetical protein [Deltaproteobacteria bacterium]
MHTSRLLLAAAASLALGACDGTSVAEPECVIDADCPGHAADNACALGARCEAERCVAVAPVDCSGFSVPQCFEPRCDPTDGSCQPSEVNYGPCDDGDACTSGETCLLGECQGGEPVSCGASGDCRSASCDPASGCVVEVVPSGVDCDDGDPCTAGDRCDGAGACRAGPRDCDDGDPCTTDACGAGGCEHAAIAEAAACDDGDPCTASDLCGASGCAGTPLADGATCFGSACTTGMTCTAGACGGGTPVADGTECEEDFACVGLATCQAGACVGPATPCPDDGNPCTVDACTANQGCLYRPVADGTACQLGPCATGGTCDNGLCLSLTVAPDGQACDSGSGCAVGETCLGGACGAGDASACLPTVAAPLPGGFLVTDNAAGRIAMLDAHGNLALAKGGEHPGPAGVTLDHKGGDGFFVTYSGTGGAHTHHKMGWDGAPTDGDVVQTGQWPLTGPCLDQSSSTGSWLISSCGKSRVVLDYAGMVLNASTNLSSSTRGVALASFKEYWSLDAAGTLSHIIDTLGGVQSTWTTGLDGARGLERHAFGFFVGSPTRHLIVQLDRLGRRVRAIPLPEGWELWDFAWLRPGTAAP